MTTTHALGADKRTPDSYSCDKQAANPNSPMSACAEYCGNMTTCFSSRYNPEKVAAQHDAIRAEERAGRTVFSEEQARAALSAGAVVARPDLRWRVAYSDDMGFIFDANDKRIASMYAKEAGAIVAAHNATIDPLPAPQAPDQKGPQ